MLRGMSATTPDGSALLTRYRRPAASVFDLLGHGEVDLTAAVGWVLSSSPTLMRGLLEVLHLDGPAAAVAVALETADDAGRTDIELTSPHWKVVIEAKQGWQLPTHQQLEQYAGRFDGVDQGLIVTMSDSSAGWAARQLPDTVDGVPVRHEPWDTIRQLIRTTRKTARSRERLWLDELEDYMGRATSLRPYDEQWIYCVSVSDKPYGAHTFKQYVTDERVYFHPYGGRNGWPKRPLTLIGFRWAGHVQQVNRVEAYEVVPDLRDRWPDMPPDAGPHIIYRLGPDLHIPTISTAGTYPSGRIWVLLDQLLTHPTLTEAVAASRELQQQFG